MSERGRKPSVPNLERVVKAIESGAYDKELAIFQESLDARRENLKGQVLEHVRQVFGKDAFVGVANTPVSEAMTPKPYRNPFMQKAGVELSDNGETAVSDPLSDLSGLDTVEAEMDQGMPMGRGGAQISGMSPRDMG